MTHLVCKMLAFTIQFPNNNPTPPHHTPSDQPSRPTLQGEACSRHRTNTETPSPNHNHPQKDDPGQEACCLKTQQCAKHIRHHHTSHDPFQQTPTRACVLNTTTNTATTMPTPPHPTPTTNRAAKYRTCFPGVKFINIPPLSNPPKQHSCLA